MSDTPLLRRIARLLVSFIGLSASQALAQPFDLAVIDGSGSGAYGEGFVVDIWANPYDDPDLSRIIDESADPTAPLRVFDRWGGDTDFVTDVFAAHTFVTIPAADIEVVAQYQDAPRWNPLRVIWRMPPDPQGVIFVFHGRFSNAFAVFNSAEQKRFVVDALARGYGVVALDSFDRASREWNESEFAPDNVDMLRTAQLRNDLIAQGAMTPGLPVYVMGLSNGGQFASLFTEANQAEIGFPVTAIAIYIASGNIGVIQTSEVPTIFAVAENDSTPNVIEGALTAFNDLVTRDVPSQFWLHAPSPVYPERFWRVDEISGFDSQAIQAALKNEGLLDVDDFLIDHPDESDWREAVPQEFQDLNSQLHEQLLVLYAEHRFMSDFNNKVLDFFDEPIIIVDVVPIVEDLSPGSGFIGSTVFIEGTNFVNVTDVAFNGVSASFQVEAATQIRAVVPSGARTGPVAVTNSVGTGVGPEDFVVLPPSIASFQPTSGIWGALVTISGSGFVDVLDVTFNGVSTPVLGGGPSTLLAQVPDGATTGPIEVTNEVGTAVSPSDFVVLAPSIDGFNPEIGSVGTLVTIHGSAFAGDLEVAFNGTAAPLINSTPSKIWVQVPEGASTGPITVTNPVGLDTSAGDFTVVEPPLVSGLDPSSGPVGTSVTLSGQNLAGATSVTFGSTEASFVVDSDIQITAEVPSGASTGKVRVTTPGGKATSPGFFLVLN